MDKEEFISRCYSDPEGRRMAYAQIIAEHILPVKNKVREIIKDTNIANEIVWLIYSLQPSIARSLSDLESPETENRHTDP
jgi:hypothetical protein